LKRLHLGAVVLAVANAAALAQDFPVRPIRMVIPFVPGGSIDTVGRRIAEAWSGTLRQQIVVDNRGGAGGNVGTSTVAHATPDGYTILYGNLGPLAIGPHLYRKLDYDVAKQLAPVSLVGSSPFVLFSSTKLPVQSVQELIPYARSRPGQLNYASSGVGSGLHLAAELFKAAAGLDIVHVPYKGLGQAWPDIGTGRVQLLVNTYPGSVPHVKAGRIRALLTGGSRRSPHLPDVPTGVEAGLPAFESTAWHAVVAPSGTPRAIVAKLQQTLATTLGQAELRERLAAEDVEPIASAPEELGRFMRSESVKWGKIVKAAGIQPE
jgi:tripartite-type tricarboxylate transporter receptor subunit TctC